MTCLHSSSVAIVNALLDHGANPNSEEGIPAPVTRANALYVQREGEEGGEMLESREEGPGAHSKVTFLVGDGDGGEQERVLNIIKEGMLSNILPDLTIMH